VRALISSLGYVTLASDQTITGLKTILRVGDGGIDVLNFKIDTSNIYALKVAYHQNELVGSGEATWSFANTFNNGIGTGITTTPISFFRGVLVTGQRLLSASVNANLMDYYGNNPSGRYPVYAYNTGVQQFASGVIVGDATGVVNAATGAIADLPAGVVANFKGRVIGSNAVNNNEFVTLSQLTTSSGAYLPLSGGTLTGPLGGTSATFSGAVSGTSGSFNGNVRAVNSYNLYKTDNTTLGGQLSYDGVINQLYLWNSISNGYFSIYTNSTERLNIGSDGTSTFKGPGVVIDRPTSSSGEPFLAFNKNGVNRASIYGADGTAGLRFFSDASTFLGTVTTTGLLTGQASIYQSDAGGLIASNRWGVYNGGATTMRFLYNPSGDVIFDNGTPRLTLTSAGSALFNVNSSSSITLAGAGTDAPIIKAGSGDELYLGGNDTWQIRFSGGNILMDNGGNVGMGEGANTIARLNVNGSTKINRSFYNWYQSYWQGNGTYWHMKTSMSGGAAGNVQYTMSLFKGYMYSYGDPSLREGSIGFHNWSGAIYNSATTGNLFTTVYVSSDNFVVLVIPSGNGETGVTIDWHQAFGYPFVTAQVTAAGLHGAATGKY
jgi:hypothetical protein